MRNKSRMSVIFTIALVLSQSVGYSQSRDEWMSLVPLKSTRTDVEKILGKPDVFFDTYGTYKTSYGRYSIWYASGHCKKKIEGRDWDTEAGVMTVLFVQPNQVDLIKDYLSNLNDYERKEAPYSRFLYSSKDKSHIFETIRRPDGVEFISGISIEPGISSDNHLCRK